MWWIFHSNIWLLKLLDGGEVDVVDFHRNIWLLKLLDGGEVDVVDFLRNNWLLKMLDGGVIGMVDFYIKNLVMGLSEAPPSDQSIRLELKRELASRGASSLMEELAGADPVSANRIHVNDEYRLLRALEVFRLSGRPLSSYASPWNRLSESSPENSPFRFLLAGLRRSREELYRRINERTAAMFRSGLAEEVRRLYEAGFTPEDPGLRAIGYREFFVQNPDNSGGTGISFGNEGKWRLSEDNAGIEALVAQNSRRYAKRQITFFASIPGVKWLGCAGDAMPDLDGILDF
jgi:tRNA dimethylallyltransferase